ncbi:MAG: DUF2723 domain-containing protein [Rubrobacter sp.]|nr:DUF2723 domain-containing protein [Rubrobacter sp.]
MRPILKKPGSYRGSLPALAGAGVCLLSFILYLRTLAPTVLYYDLPVLRDSAVLQVKAYVLGIPDYTGYPTYVMLGKLFTYLPVGDVAYRVNLASAVYAALAVLFVFLIGWLLTGRSFAAAAGALAFGVSRIFWSQAVIAEVYTLNALFVSLTIFVFLIWRKTRRDRYLLLGAFLCGLSLTHHITSGLLIPAGFFFVLVVDRKKVLEVGLILKAAGLFLLGLLPYAYLPIRASMDYLPPGWTWDQPKISKYPPDTIYGFYNLVSGGAWKGRMWAFGPAELPDRISMYLNYLYGNFGQFHVALVLVALLGVFYLIYRDASAAVLLGIPFLGWLFHALEYNIEDIQYYFIPTYLILGVLMAAGFSALLDAIDSLAERVPSAVRLGLVVVLSVLFLVFPLLGTGATYAAVDRSGDYEGRRMMDAVATETKPNSTVLHHRSPLYYMILVQHRREDLTLINYLEKNAGPPRFKGVPEAKAALEDGPVYVLLPGKTTTPYYMGVTDSERLYGKAGLDLIPVNENVLLYQVVRRGTGGA